MQHLDSVLAIAVVATGLGWTVWVLAQWRIQVRRNTTTAEFYRRLLERFGSSEDLGRFLDSDGGRQLLARIGDEPTPRGNGTLRLMQAGVIVAFLAVSFLFVGEMQNDPGATSFGVITLAAGLGCLAASLLTHLFKGLVS